MVTDTPALGVVIPPAPPWYTARAREIWVEDICAVEGWRAGTVATAGAQIGAVVVAAAGLSIKAVGAVVLALLSELAADREETGMLTSVPAWPFTDKGSWMRSGWPVAIMLLPGAVFSSKVPVGLWVVMPVAKLEAALEEEVISWRMGACETMVVEVGVGAGAAAGAGRAAGVGTAVLDRETVVGVCFTSMEVRTGR